MAEKKELTLVRGFEAFLAESKNASAEDCEKPPKEWKRLALVFDGYGTRVGCIRDGGALFGDVCELEQEIESEFYEYWAYLRNIVQKKLGLDYGHGFISITVSPSHEDTTGVILTQDTLRHIVLKTECKAWNFQWDSPEDMEEEMQSDLEAIEKGAKVPSLLKLFRATINVRDGENEYDTPVLIEALDIDAAILAGNEIARTWYGENGTAYDGDTYEEDGGYRLIECEGVNEIERTFEALLAVLGNTYKAADLVPA